MGQGGILKLGKQRRNSHLCPHPRIKALFPEPSRNRCRPPETVPPRKRAGAAGVEWPWPTLWYHLGLSIAQTYSRDPSYRLRRHSNMLISIRRGSGSLLAVVLRSSDVSTFVRQQASVREVWSERGITLRTPPLSTPFSA